MDVTYLGEHTWAGQLGHWLVLLAFGGSLLSLAGYFLYTRSNDDGWRTVGRIGFRTHSVGVAGIVVLLFIMLFNHWFEFDYVWKHSNRGMPLRYIASCFWEGQEGSFLLWSFWNMIIGNILIQRKGTRTSPGWEGPVMTIVALVQLALAWMLLGVYLFGVRMGSSPFLLIRELPENIGLPWTHLADYLTRIPQFADGRGLNPLLQNYWMVIHPPTLFLGFGLTLVPFAFACAGLWRGRLKEWIAPAIPWTFTGVLVLGTGILMGGAWAYEALSFGGFWAWDPVENAVLVPWITLIASGHLLLINRRKDTSLFTTFLLTLGTYLLVLYSTFLTRSGVLGDTSVHSFTGEGMLPGLLTFLLFFIALCVALLNTDPQDRRFMLVIAAVVLILGAALKVMVPAILLFGLIALAMTMVAYRKGPYHYEVEEQVNSREFWLFIGALVLLLSAAQIIAKTSTPVWGQLGEPFDQPRLWLAQHLGWDWITPAKGQLTDKGDVKAVYNRIQVPFAFIVCMLVAIGQYLRYKHTDMKRALREMAGPFTGAVLLTALGVWLLGYTWRDLTLVALFFATCFAFLANAWYVPAVLKGKLDKAGPSVAHVGFALVLLGALVSTSRSHEISRNVAGPQLSGLNKEFDDQKDMLLYLGDTLPMGDRFVTFTGKRQQGVDLYFDMDYLASVPRRFHAGDTVRVRNALFRAKDDHQAGIRFLNDQPGHWEAIEEFTKGMLWHAPHWTPREPGPKEFSLEPLVQLNPRFGNVAEPSTRHWPHQDLYTHIRYAKLDTTSDGYMPPLTVERHVGDTIATATCLVVLDSISGGQDSSLTARFGTGTVAYFLYLRVRDRFDTGRWFSASPFIIYRFGQAIGSKAFEVPALNTRIQLTSVEGKRVGLNISEREFVIMQAIVFPGINILWIGCVLMALGSFMAVRQRLRA
ncbi:MAG: cytochrome c biogenesis protein CcsA [Flavobacteriales bacterium]